MRWENETGPSKSRLNETPLPITQNSKLTTLTSLAPAKTLLAMGSPTKKPATNTDQQQIHELEYTPDDVTDTLPILDENPLPPKSLKRAKEKPVKKNMVPYENRAVYVSGLPTDTNEEEVVEYFEKVGSIGLDYKGRTRKIE